MDAQLLLVILVVASSAAYLARRAWTTWRGGCHGCSAPRASGRGVFIPSDQVTLRRRSLD